MTRACLLKMQRTKRPAWKIAVDADLHPSTLSKLMIGYHRWAGPTDGRIIALARVLDMDPEDCVEPVDE